jgi:hypothetical protein
VLVSCAKGREHVEFSGPSGSPSEAPTGEYDPWTLVRVNGLLQRWEARVLISKKKFEKREGHYQGSDASDEVVPMVGSQGVGNGEDF